jgi:carboxyl-terminal processing protease
MRKTLTVVITTLVVVSLVAFSFWLVISTTRESKLKEEVYDLLSQYYVNPNAITPELLKKGSVDEMLAALNDPYTFHINASAWQEWQSYFEGNLFIGIGVKFSQGELDGEIVPAILGVVPHSPADEAGIEPGDLVLEIDGNSAIGRNATWAALETRGDEGTNVTLTFCHQDREPVTLEVTRQKIDVSTWWEGLVDGDIAYIDIDYFSDLTDDNLNFTLYDLQDDDVAGIILDLRDNPGGVVDAAAEVADQFLGGNITILYIVYGDGRQEIFTAESRGLAENPAWKVAVLVNGNTASAAEMVAGALQDHARAALIGNETYGKGCMQYIIELSDGSAVSITCAYWYTPNRFENGTYLTREHGLIPDMAGGLQEAIDYIK